MTQGPRHSNKIIDYPPKVWSDDCTRLIPQVGPYICTQMVPLFLLAELTETIPDRPLEVNASELKIGFLTFKPATRGNCKWSKSLQHGRYMGSYSKKPDRYLSSFGWKLRLQLMKSGRKRVKLSELAIFFINFKGNFQPNGKRYRPGYFD